MSKAPSMPVFPDALIADTTDLNMEEFGAYCMILMVTWRNNGQPLPDDATRMARVCRMTEKRWVEKVRPSIARFFDLSGGLWRQGRLEKEWEYVSRQRAIQSEKGKKGGRPRGADGEKRSQFCNATSQCNNDVFSERNHLKNNDSDKAAAFSQLKPQQSPQPHIELTIEAGASMGAAGADGGQPQSDADDPPPPIDQPATDDPSDPTDAELVWGRGLQWLAKSTGKKPDRLRSLVGRWCKGGREAVVLALMRECREHSPPIADPVPWIETALANRSEANVRQAQQHRPAAHATRPSTSDILAGVLAAVDPQLQRH